MKIKWLTIILAVGSAPAWSQQIPDFSAMDSQFVAEGWRGFTDVAFLANAFLTMTLASVLGAIIAFHPRYTRSVDTFAEIEAPKVYIMYAVIGALIGIMVVKYGLVIGFVLFGIGGLIRFRTVLRSAHLTGHVIFVTLIGLSCGLELPHVAVLATAFGFVLIYVLDARITYRIAVKPIPREHVVEAAAAYREVLMQQGCHILSEKKNTVKERISFIFRTSSKVTRLRLEEALEADVDERLKGPIDWEID